MVNRGAAIHGDKVFFGTLDAGIVALHKDTGKVVWREKFGDHRAGYTMTGAPTIIKDQKTGKTLLIHGCCGGIDLQGVRSHGSWRLDRDPARVPSQPRSSPKHRWPGWNPAGPPPAFRSAPLVLQPQPYQPAALRGGFVVAAAGAVDDQ